MVELPPKKIAILGPVAPYRSGIARHTSALAKEIASREGTQVRVFSFSRQYPKLLFPGEEQRDPTLAAPGMVEVEECIDTANPLNWKRTIRKVEMFAPDLVVIPCWTFFMAPALGAMARSLRRRGIEVVAMVHNARDHEAAGWKNRLLVMQLRAADRAVTHNDSLARDIADIAPQLPTAVTPHPLYDDYPQSRIMLERTASLELLFYGIVRPYKGLDILLESLAASKNRDIHLTVAGEFWSDVDETRDLIERLGIGSRVELLPGYASDDATADLFARSDALVAPYRTATGSGVLALAAHYQRPVIASDIAGLADAVEHGVTGLLFPAGGVSALARILDEPGLTDRLASMRPSIVARKSLLGWDRLADAVLSPNPSTKG